MSPTVTVDAEGTVTGNTYDKYNTTNPVAKRLQAGFESALEDLFAKAAPQSLLDVGCGEAHHTHQWAQQLGDKRVADDLTKMLTDSSDNNLAKLSAVASAIGRIGDSRTVMPLKRMLFDKTNLTDLSRAFAAVALGGVADKEMLPWNAKIGVDNNYRASVETLTNQQSGILDIL